MDKIFEQVLLENNKAIAERDARIKELEAELKRLTEEGVISETLRVNKELWSRIKELEADAEFNKGVIELSQRVEAENIKLNAELSRIKEGVEKLPVIPVKRTASFESVDVVSTIDVILKSDLDKLMKGGE